MERSHSDSVPRLSQLSGGPEGRRSRHPPPSCSVGSHQQEVWEDHLGPVLDVDRPALSFNNNNPLLKHGRPTRKLVRSGVIFFLHMFKCIYTGPGQVYSVPAARRHEVGVEGVGVGGWEGPGRGRGSVRRGQWHLPCVVRGCRTAGICSCRSQCRPQCQAPPVKTWPVRLAGESTACTKQQ